MPFAKWLATRLQGSFEAPRDRNAELIEGTLIKLLDQGLRIPRGGYGLRRGRGRVIIERAA